MSGQQPPGPLSVELRMSDRNGDQYAIESDSETRFGEWRDVYVHFSGYFGSYGPHVFAAAPELLEALELLLNDVGSASSLPGAVKARAAIARATGVQS